MDTLQTWIIVGVPTLLLVASCLVGRSNVRAWLAYGSLAVGTIVFVVVPGDALSAALLGLIAFALVASGRGQTDDHYPEHHENRKRFTTVKG